MAPSEVADTTMRLSADRLEGHLAKALAPVYLIAGDDPLLVDEAADAVRARARADGFDERERHVAESGFDWAAVGEASATMSLFARRKLIEIRVPTGKPGAKGGAALGDLAEKADRDTCLIVICPRIDKKAQQAKWVKRLDKAGVFVQVWPVDLGRLPGWIAGRMKARGLTPSGDAVAMLADRVQGNLLAADQEIEKLLLINGPGAVDGEAVARAVADSARFDVFALADCALLGDLPRALRILDGLRAEGVEGTLVLWALGREVRVLVKILTAVERGTSLERAMAAQKVWSNRTTLVARSARRVRSAAAARRLLALCAEGDLVLKGRRHGETWQMLTALLAALTGAQDARHVA